MSLAKDVVMLSTKLNLFISDLKLNSEITIDKFCSSNDGSLIKIIFDFVQSHQKDLETATKQNVKDNGALKDFFLSTCWEQKDEKNTWTDVNKEFLQIRRKYIELAQQLQEKQFRNCLKSIDILCKKNFDGNFLDNKIDLSGIFKNIKEEFMLLMKELKEEQAQARKNKLSQAKALKDLKDLENRLKQAQNAQNEDKFLDSINDAYDGLCLLAELDSKFKKNKDKAKGLAKWYNDYNPNKTQEKNDKIDAILAIGEPKYITKSFFGLFDMSKRLKLVRKYLPKIKKKWEGFQMGKNKK